MGLLDILFGWAKKDTDVDPYLVEPDPASHPTAPDQPHDSPIEPCEPAASGETFWWKNPVPIPENPVEFESINTEDIYNSIAHRLLKKEITLVDIPDTIIDTMRVLDQEEFDFSDVAQQIEKSPSLLGEFLKAANSAQFSRGSKVTNIRVILPRLGRSNVKGILYLSSSKMAVPSHELFTVVASEIVEHSMVVGRIAEYLSQHYYTDPNKAFLAGLMHDVGKMAIIKEVGETMALPEGLDLAFSEALFNNIFPDLHVDAGELIGTYWQLDSELIQGIKHHHDDDFMDEKDSLLLPALINFSDTCARMLGFGRPLGDVDIFSLPSAKALYIENTIQTHEFLQGIMDLFEAVETT